MAPLQCQLGDPAHVRSPDSWTRRSSVRLVEATARRPEISVRPSTMTVSMSLAEPYSTSDLIGSCTAPKCAPRRSTSTMSARAPGARRPRSSRPSARAPPSVAASNTSLRPADSEAAFGEAAHQPRQAHLGDQVLREGVGAQRDVDPELAVALERLEHDAHLGVLVRRVRDRGARIGQQLQIVDVRVVRPRMVRVEDAVPEQHVVPQESRCRCSSCSEVRPCSRRMR